MEYDIKHHMRYYDGTWIMVLCMFSLPCVVIAMLDNKLEGLSWFVAGFIFIELPLIVIMQIQKILLKRLYKSTAEQNGTARFIMTNRKLTRTVEDKDGHVYKLRGTYGNLDKESYRCKFIHNKKIAWITYIYK